jgi:hypothetical protein
MPTRSGIEWYIDYKALDAFLKAKGLVPRSLKWHEVRGRYLKKYRSML